MGSEMCIRDRPAGPPPYGPARNNLGDPEPPRRRLEYPGGGAGGGELPQYDNEPAGEPEGRGRRAPGGAWGQLSEEARDELTRPLRVESGRTDEPRTIERPRVRARLVDQGERARPPGGGSGCDPMPPSSPGETSAGPSTLSEPVELREAGEDERPQRRKRHQQRGKRPHRPSYDARQASKRTNRGEPEPREDGRWSSGTED